MRNILPEPKARVTNTQIEVSLFFYELWILLFTRSSPENLNFCLKNDEIIFKNLIEFNRYSSNFDENESLWGKTIIKIGLMYTFMRIYRFLSRVELLNIYSKSLWCIRCIDQIYGIINHNLLSIQFWENDIRLFLPVHKKKYKNFILHLRYSLLIKIFINKLNVRLW